VTAAVAAAGWLLALAAAWRVLALGRRLELVASAEHELRGPLAALTLAAARSRPVQATVVESQLERARVALADLAEARRGRRALARTGRHELRELAERAAAGWTGAGAHITLDWRAGQAAVEADPARISQALGNLLSNALEHGEGRVAVRGMRQGSDLRIEIADRGPGFVERFCPRRGRGRGLAIAALAVEESGGRMRIGSDRDGAVVAVELPLADA
jgi:signal transduction histidine kinase